MEIWVVGYHVEGYQGSECRTIECLCLSEEMALKKWEEIKNRRIKDIEKYIREDLSRGFDPRGWEIGLKEKKAWTVQDSPLFIEKMEAI
jgi:hypothetical protein